jgi:antitoxin HigA-1
MIVSFRDEWLGAFFIDDIFHPSSTTRRATKTCACRPVDDEAQAGERRRDPRTGGHAADGLILARVFGNSPEFWLKLQRRTDLWKAMNSPRERERIKRARPISRAAA